MKAKNCKGLEKRKFEDCKNILRYFEDRKIEHFQGLPQILVCNRNPTAYLRFNINFTGMSLKKKIYDECLVTLEQRLMKLDDALKSVEEAINNETKSTVGDKHETARAMMQLEQEKLAKQVQELNDQKLTLEKLNISSSESKITAGSLINTDKGYFFLATALGKIIANHKTVMVLSPQSPLGKKFLGLKVNETAEINGITYKVQEII